MKKPIVVGFDFDGVIAYNPARLIRFPISYVKKNILGIDKVTFFVPKTPIQRLLWSLAHESSMFPARGATKLRHLVQEGRIEAHLVTGRFGFLRSNLMRFLKMWGMEDLFTTITLNEREEQPHEFKANTVKNRRFEVYVEDNLDIVRYMHSKRLKTRVFWIYNVFDRNEPYPHKFPYLEKALMRI